MSSKSPAPPEQDDLPTEANDYSQARETVPVQYARGRRATALQWLTPATDLISVQAPDTAGGKK